MSATLTAKPGAADGISGAGATHAHAAVLFANFGFYHIARLNALRAVCQATGVEFAGEQRLYGWRTEKDNLAIRTLYPGVFEDITPGGVLKSCMTLWKILQDLKPSHLFIPGYTNARCFTAAFWAITHRAESILMYESTEQDKPRSQLKERIKAAIIRLLFSQAFVGGFRSAAYLQKLGFRKDKITTKYDVVDNDFFERGIRACREYSSPSASGLPDHYFLFVGRLAPEKNGIGLLDAFRRYRERGGTWDLVLVGRGHLEEDLLALSTHLQVRESVHFAGFKNGEELFPYYAFASCFVLPSTREPWGLVVNEAMASGLPVLVSAACGCVPDLVQEGVNGYSFDPGTAQELSELFLKVASLSEAARSEMGSASKRIIANYAPADWAGSASKLVFNSLRNKRSTV